MYVLKSRPSWALAESAATPEHVFFNRRAFMAAGTATAGAMALGIGARRAHADADPSAGLYPVKRNEAYKLDREITAEEVSTHYNNYYEFSTSKNLADAAQALPIRPWTVTVDGLCAKPETIDIDDLLKRMPLEERLYRHRCVEAWSMAVPWSGFPLAALVKMAEPSSDAKYVRFETFLNADVAPGQNDFYPWPYIEGVTIDEAMNDLAFMVTGMYGKPAPKQNGAPLRIALPWKYGFKSGKGLVKISFVADRPLGMWQALQASEYGFWANVNPEVSHPRWSQAEERVIGTDTTVPTQLFNGYAEQVAGLYKGLESEPLYM